MKEHQENAAQTVKNTVQTANNVVQAAENAAQTAENSAQTAETKEAGWHHEDLALKTAAQYFGEELLPLLGIEETVEYVAPTELVRLEARQLYQDFNYVAKKNTWVHLEFESDAITNEDLKRFREYEAATSRAHKVNVITYVICSSNVKNLKSELTVGINVYRVKVIQLKEWDSDPFFNTVEEKRAKGEVLTKSDLVPLLLTPLMSGSLQMKERILKGLKILHTADESITRLEMEKMQAVLYTFADKFLEKDDLNKVKEVIAMTTLGQMIFDDGVEKGLEQGIRAMVMENLEDGITDERICEKLQKHFSLSKEEADEKLREYKVTVQPSAAL